MTEIGLPCVVSVSLQPHPTGILTECTVRTNLYKALNLEFDWVTFEHAPVHVPRSVIFAPETYAYRFIILVDLVLNGCPHHITIAHVRSDRSHWLGNE